MIITSKLLITKNKLVFIYEEEGMGRSELGKQVLIFH